MKKNTHRIDILSFFRKKEKKKKHGLSLQLEDHESLILLISLHGSCFTPTHVLF